MHCMRRIYLEESVRAAGEFTDSLEDDLADAQKILGLGPREAEDIRSEIVSKTYKCALRLLPPVQRTSKYLSLEESMTGFFAWK